MRKYIIACSIIVFSGSYSFAQQTGISLKQCFDIAAQNNIMVQQMEQSLETRMFQQSAAKKNYLPKVDLLGAYTYLGNPIRINLQTVRDGIIDGTSQQNVEAANKVYHEITGNNLSQQAQDAIYQGSRNIIGGLYPNYNPALSEQQYFTAGLDLRMPIYLGGKLKAAQRVADKRVTSGKLNLQFTQNTINLAITTQYLQVLYFNTLLANQKEIFNLHQKTSEMAAELVKNEIIPPYQAHWSNVALQMAETQYQSFQLEKDNALLLLQHLLGTDSLIILYDTLKPVDFTPAGNIENYVEGNIGYQWLQSNTEEAKSAISVSKSLSLPNVFGIANYQFLQKNLPVITPPWMVGLLFQWNLFSGFENRQHVKAAQSLVKESELLAEKKKKDLTMEIIIAENKLKSIRSQVNTLDAARKEAANTTEMIRRRMKNQLSSVKDVNDALKVQLEADKAYYTSVLAYNIAVATYLNITGKINEAAKYF